jgi:adenylate cyclase class 2
MQAEIEAKFLNVDHDVLRECLKAAGAICRQPMRLMKRKAYDFSDNRLRSEHNGWARVRDEGDKVTMSYKQLNNRELDGTHEVNLVIDDFAAGDTFLQQLGLESKSYQETKRESWTLPGFEIELDIWPWTKPYIEIEGPDEASLRVLAGKLGLDWGAVCHGSVEVVYRAEYDVTDEEVNTIPRMTFEESIPDWLEERRK